MDNGRVKSALVDTSKADRIRSRELLKSERERQFGLLKNSTLPVVEPDMRIVMNLKCETCNEGSERFTKRNDWIMDCIDLKAKLKAKKGVLGRLKELIIEPDPTIVHPANFVMLKNIQAKYPDVPIVFVMRSCLPDIDLQLVADILDLYNIKIQAIIPGNPYSVKPSESILSSVLQKRGNILLVLDELDNSDLDLVLKACNFGLAVKIFMLPITINSDNHFNEYNRGFIKVNFVEPYTVADILKRTDAEDDPEKATSMIFDHLNYDVTMNSPIMTTSVVAFLLMTKFREVSTTLQELCKASDELFQMHPMLDYAFEGETKDVVNDGVEILREYLVIKDNSIKIIEKEDPATHLYSYARALMPYYLHESIIMRCAKELRKVKGIIDYNTLISYSVELSEMLEYAVPLSKPCQNLDSLVQNAFDALCTQEFLHKPMAPVIAENQRRARAMARQYDDSDDDDGIPRGYAGRNPEDEVTIVNQEAEKLDVLVIPMIDAYITMAYGLKLYLCYDDFFVESFILESIKIMGEEVFDKTCKYYESCSTLLTASCLKHFAKRKFVEIQGEIMVIHPDHNNLNAVKTIIRNMFRFLKPAPRVGTPVNNGPVAIAQEPQIPVNNDASTSKNVPVPAPVNKGAVPKALKVKIPVNNGASTSKNVPVPDPVNDGPAAKTLKVQIPVNNGASTSKNVSVPVPVNNGLVAIAQEPQIPVNNGASTSKNVSVPVPVNNGLVAIAQEPQIPVNNGASDSENGHAVVNLLKE